MDNTDKRDMSVTGARWLIAIFVSLLIVGCSSGNDSSTTGTAGLTTGNGVSVGTFENDIGTNGPGLVTFNFLQARTPLEVPVATTTFDFIFYSGVDATGSVVQEENRPFAPIIVIDPVTGEARSCKIIARDTSGFPLVQSVVGIAVNSTVDFASATTAIVTVENFFVSPPLANVESSSTQQFRANLAFSNGEVKAADNVTWSATGQMNVDGNGLGTALNEGAGTVTAERNGTLSASNVTIGGGPILTTITLLPEDPVMGLGSETQFSATAVDQNGDPFTLTELVWSSIDGDGAGTIDTTGLFTATGTGNVTVTASEGRVANSTQVQIKDTVPVVLLDNETLALTVATGALMVAPSATVDDDQLVLDGGTLSISLDPIGDVTDAQFTDPGSINIGTVTGNGTNNLSVQLDPNAALANIESFLRSITIRGVSETGSGTVHVELSDGQGNDAMTATRPFTFYGVTLVVDLLGGGDHTKVQDAIDAVVNINTGVPSKITILDGDFFLEQINGDPILFIDDDPNLLGLTICGNNAGISLGVDPETRKPETEIGSIFIFADDVTLDGLKIRETGGECVTCPADGVTITNCNFDSTGLHGISVTGASLSVTNSYFRGFTQAILSLDPATGGVFRGNAFIRNSIGLILQDVDGSEVVTGNGFSDHDDEHLRVSGRNTVSAVGNAFQDGGRVSTSSSATINAQNSWWGANSEPTAAEADASVNFTPILTSDPFPNFPHFP